MEKQKLKELVPTILLIVSSILCLISIFPVNIGLIITGICLSIIVLFITIFNKKQFKNNYFILTIVLVLVAFITDVSFLYYVLFMI